MIIDVTWSVAVAVSVMVIVDGGTVDTFVLMTVVAHFDTVTVHVLVVVPAHTVFVPA